MFCVRYFSFVTQNDLLHKRGCPHGDHSELPSAHAGVRQRAETSGALAHCNLEQKRMLDGKRRIQNERHRSTLVLSVKCSRPDAFRARGSVAPEKRSGSEPSTCGRGTRAAGRYMNFSGDRRDVCAAVVPLRHGTIVQPAPLTSTLTALVMLSATPSVGRWLGVARRSAAL